MSMNASICPKCGRPYTERPALSREDNRTAICPACGTLEAIAALPDRTRFPRKAAAEVLTWMNEQMNGREPTEWSSGDERDRMADAADLLQRLAGQPMLKRVCRYSVFSVADTSGLDELRTVSFAVFGETDGDLDCMMNEAVERDSKLLPDSEYIDDLSWGVDVPAEWNELMEEWE